MKGGCSRCGGATDAIYRLCDSCLGNEVVESRAAQGFPPTIENPVVLSTLGRFFRPEPKNTREARPGRRAS